MTAPLRIVHLSTAEFGGGAERIANKLHHALLERGHESLLLVGGKESEDPSVVALGDGAPGEVRRFAMRVADRLGREYRFRPGAGAVRARVSGQVDVFHAHNLHGGYVDPGIVAGLARRAPTVLTLQDMWLLTGHCAHAFGCPRWEKGCGACPDLRTYPAIPRDATRGNRRRKARVASGTGVRLSAPSTWLLDRIGRSDLASVPRRLVPNAVDVEVFRAGDGAEARAALGLPPDRPLVLFPANVGLQNEFKDGATLLGALAQIRDLRPVLAAFGRAPDVEGVEVLTLDYTSSEERMAAYYRAADVVAYPSRADTAPIAPMEAGACGRPVVASAVGGIPEIVLDGETGYVVAPGVEPFAAALGRLLESEELRRRLGDAAERSVRERYALRQVVDTWVDWYAELAAGRN